MGLLTTKPEDLLKTTTEQQVKALQNTIETKKAAVREDSALLSQVNRLNTPNTAAGLAKGALAFAGSFKRSRDRKAVEQAVQEYEDWVNAKQQEAEQIIQTQKSLQDIAVPVAAAYDQYSKDKDIDNLKQKLQSIGKSLSVKLGGEPVSVDFLNNDVSNLVVSYGDNTKVIPITDVGKLLPAELQKKLIYNAMGTNKFEQKAEEAKQFLLAQGIDEKQADEIAKKVALGTKFTGDAKELTDTTKLKLAGIQTALDNFNALEGLFFNDNGEFDYKSALSADVSRITGLTLPSAFSKSFAKGNAILATGLATLEPLIRFRSGAAVPEEEVTRYLQTYLPNAADNTETAQWKLALLHKSLSDINKALGVYNKNNMTEEQWNAAVKSVLSQERAKMARLIAERQTSSRTDTANKGSKNNLIDLGKLPQAKQREVVKNAKPGTKFMVNGKIMTKK